MCYKTPKSDVASCFSRLTGRDYENCLMDLSRIDKPSAFDSLVNFSIRGFGRFSKSDRISEAGITGTVSRLIGKSFEVGLKLEKIKEFRVPIKHEKSIHSVFKIVIFFLLVIIPQNGYSFTVQNRGTWLGRQWLEHFDQEKIEKLAIDIKRYRINVIYPALSYGLARKIAGTDKIGWINDPENAKRFMKEIRKRCPGISIIPYKGVRVCGEKHSYGNGKVRIYSLWNSKNRREKAVNALYNSMRALDADGIQFDLECSDIDDSANIGGLDAFFRVLKKRIGNEKILSVAIPVLSPDSKYYGAQIYRSAPWRESIIAPWAPRWGRAPHVYKVLFNHCDEIAVMYYDTWIRKAQRQRFIDLVTAQSWASAWFSKKFGAKFIAGVRLSTTHGRHPRSKGTMHDYTVENIPNTIAGLRQASNKLLGEGHSAGAFLRGMIIFRLDVIYEKSWKSDIGQDFLEAFRRYN